MSKKECTDCEKNIEDMVFYLKNKPMNPLCIECFNKNTGKDWSQLFKK